MSDGTRKQRGQGRPQPSSEAPGVFLGTDVEGSKSKQPGRSREGQGEGRLTGWSECGTNELSSDLVGVRPRLRGAQTAGPCLPATPAQAGSPDRGCGSVRKPRLPREAAPARWGRKLRHSGPESCAGHAFPGEWDCVVTACAAAAGLCCLAHPAPSASWGSKQRR